MGKGLVAVKPSQLAVGNMAREEYSFFSSRTTTTLRSAVTNRLEGSKYAVSGGADGPGAGAGAGSGAGAWGGVPLSLPVFLFLPLLAAVFIVAIGAVMLVYPHGCHYCRPRSYRHL